MDTALPQKFPFILDKNLAKANCTGNRVCTSFDIVVVDLYIYIPLSILKDSCLFTAWRAIFFDWDAWQGDTL